MAAPTADTLQPVELADGVEIHLRVAGPAVRSAAYLIDWLIFVVVLFVLILALLFLAAPVVGPQVAFGIGLLIGFLLAWFYNVFFEMSKRAATPGQRAMGLKVASVSGGPVRLPQSLTRNLLRFVDIMPGFYLFGLICCLFTQRFQRLGDLVADTVVIYADQEPRNAAAMKVNADPVAPGAALSREEQAALIDFLDRAPRWSDARKTEMADVLSPLTERTGLAGLVRLCGMALWLQQGHKSTTPDSTRISS
jgi:uncharacterized RDD family membrane protein YckC